MNSVNSRSKNDGGEGVQTVFRPNPKSRDHCSPNAFHLANKTGAKDLNEMKSRIFLTIDLLILYTESRLCTGADNKKLGGLTETSEK